MKLATTDAREYEGNFEGEEIAVGIHDIRLIIDRLTDMYADREMACIREYACNAWDAHVEAGVTSPIEVTTPSGLEPFLTIRDFGVGLTLEDIRLIYSQYGASTKRNTNTQTGAFGLGCKSALAYSDQFTVTSVKDGVRIQVVVTRDAAKGIVMKVVDTSDTSDANGTTVMIPARSYNTFEQKARQFFKYWNPDERKVKLNGREPAFMPDVQWVTDTIAINPRGQSNTVVMGGVPYPASIDIGLSYYATLTAFVPIGSLEIPGNRESLIDSDLTMDTLNQVKRAFRDGLHKAIQRDVANAGSAAEAATTMIAWRAKIGNQHMPGLATLQYKGVQVRDSYTCEFDTIAANRWASKMSAHSTYRKDQTIPLPNVNGSVWVTGFDYVNFTATVRKKLEKWVEDNDLQIEGNFFLTVSDQKPDTTWLQDITFVDWPTIKAIKLPRNARNNQNGRIPGSYDIFESGDLNEDVPADDIDANAPLFWMIGKYYEGRKAAEWLNESYPGSTLVMMRAGREDKFKRLFPSAKSALDVIHDAYKKWEQGINKNDAQALYLRENMDSRLHKLDEKRLDDPAIAVAKKVATRDTSKLEDEAAAWRQFHFYWSPDEVKGVENPLDKYPLLPESYYFGRYAKRFEDHMYRYMNAEYAYLKEQS